MGGIRGGDPGDRCGSARRSPPTATAVWLACLCGLLLFLLVPLAWEAFGTWCARRTWGKRPGLIRPRILTLRDRLVLRAPVINLVALMALLVRLPETTFAALSTRATGSSTAAAAPRSTACAPACCSPPTACSGRTRPCTPTPRGRDSLIAEHEPDQRLRIKALHE